MIEDESKKFNTFLAFMDKFDDKVSDGVTFFSVQKNLIKYSKKELRSLANFFIHSLHNHAIENESLAYELNEIKIKKVSLYYRNLELEAEVAMIKNKNKMLSDKLKGIIGKMKATKSFTSLKENLKK